MRESLNVGGIHQTFFIGFFSSENGPYSRGKIGIKPYFYKGIWRKIPCKTWDDYEWVRLSFLS